MSKVSLRRLLSRLTALALTTSSIAPAAADDKDGDFVLESDLPIDREHIEPPHAALALGRGLALAVERMRPLEATQLMSTWALSEEPVRRLAVAYSLEWTFRLVGDSLVLDHLSRDPDPAIRTAVARAAWMRRASGGDVGVLARLADDPDPSVRAVARNAG